MALAGLLSTSSLAGAVPKPPPPTTVITVDSAFDQTLTTSVPGDGLPSTPGKGTSYVVAGAPFDVSFSSNLPLSTTKSTHVVLTALDGTNPVTGSTDVPAGETTGTIAGITLSTVANNVNLHVAVDERRTEVQPGDLPVDVLRFSSPAPDTSTLIGISGGGSPGVECHPTTTDPICGDLLVPDGIGGPGFVSQACNGPCGAHGSYVQALIETAGIYSKTNPFEVVFKCDKSLCPGKAIKTYSVKVELIAGTGAVASPPCASKGVIDPDPDVQFCTDYVQSSRDNAGDVLLHVELPFDAKVIW
jgi:hypothetical protein